MAAFAPMSVELGFRRKRSESTTAGWSAPHRLAIHARGIGPCRPMQPVGLLNGQVAVAHLPLKVIDPVAETRVVFVPALLGGRFSPRFAPNASRPECLDWWVETVGASRRRKPELAHTRFPSAFCHSEYQLLLHGEVIGQWSRLNKMPGEHRNRKNDSLMPPRPLPDLYPLHPYGALK